MAKTVDYYLSHMSPWTYLGHQRLIDICTRAGATVNYMPVEGGRLFAASGTLPLPKRPVQRQAYRMHELKRWRDRLGLELTLKPKYHPGPDEPSARLAIAARMQGADAGAFSYALLRACWVKDRNLADPDTLIAIAGEQGLDGRPLYEASLSDAVTKELDRLTDKGIEAGVFGYPWYVVDGEPFWGQDRLDFVEERLAS